MGLLKDTDLVVPQPVWKDITNLRLAVSSFVPQEVFNETFQGSRGESIPFEARRRLDIEKDIFGQGVHPFGYVRVGNTILMDHRIKEMLPAQLREDHDTQVVWLHNFATDIGEYTHLLHAQLPLYALAEVDVAGKHVLDLGAGDGVMGLTAYKLGAKKVSSVELYGGFEELYRAHIAVNQFPESAFTFIQGDITEPDSLKARIQEPVDIVIANIGPTYGDIHLEAIRLLQHIPSARTFIGGAYIHGHPTMDSEEAGQLLATLGFSRNFRDLRWRKIGQTVVVDKSK